MNEYDVVIVGGSAAGLTAAMTARKHYPEKSILLVRNEDQVSIPCGIPYAFGTVKTPQKNLIPADAMLSGWKVDSVIDTVERIDRQGHQFSTTGGKTIGYRKMILGTGSQPVMPKIPGIDKEGVYGITKNVPALEKMIEKLDSSQSLCILGGGFIGVEIAEECRRRCPELKITIIEMQNHCLQLVYDDEFCLSAEESLRKANISLILGEQVTELIGKRAVEGIRTDQGNEIQADMVIVGVGSRPQIEPARSAGLEIGSTGAISVDRGMRTSDPDIFACGDCTEKVSFFDGKPSTLKLASIATTEARIAGANLFVPRRTNDGAIGVFSTVVGGVTYASAGLTASQAETKGFKVVIGEAEAINRHPGGMPGAEMLKVRLVFNAENGVILGGQVTGAVSGGELIHTVSACISQKMTADAITTFQTGTHPALTASPIAYQLVNAAENGVVQLLAR